MEPHIPSSICCFSLWLSMLLHYKLILSSEQKNKSKHTVREKYPYSEFSDLYFPVFQQNTERCELFLSIQSKCGKIRTRKTPNTDTFHAVTRNTIATRMRVKMGHLRHFSVGFHKSYSFLSCIDSSFK